MKKKGIWLICLCVVLTVLGLNWNHWFGDLTEPAYRLPFGIQRVMMMPGDDGLHSRTLTWVSGESGTYYVTISSDSISECIESVQKAIKTRGGKTYVYHCELPPLPSGDYQYRIDEKSGNEYFKGSFTIPDSLSEQNFVLIGDLQDGSSEEAAPFIQSIDQCFPAMTAWLFIGDQLERPHERSWNVFYESIRTIAMSTPIIAIAGNHEYEWGLPFKLGPRWSEEMIYPYNGPNGQVGKSFYVDYPHVRIVCLDTNTLYAHLSSVREWLDKVLTQRQDNPFLIVMGHHGVYSVRKGRSNLRMRHFIRPILEEKGVHLVLSGHDHAYARDGETGSPYYVTTTSSWKSYPVGDPSKHIVSMSGDRYYQHIRVTSDSLYFKTYDSKGNEVDAFNIVK